MTVADLAAELSRSREPFVQATVVRAQKPASAHAGDTALVRADGRIDGFVGGTCAESSVREYGLMTLSTREPLLLRILPGEQPPRTSEEGAVTVANPCLSGGSVEIFLEPRVPAPRLLVVGESPIAQALVTLGEPLGFDAVLGAGEDAGPAAGDAALVVASHGRGEEPALTAALRLGVPYVGLVASRIRGAAVLAALDVPDELRSRVHSPAGLDLGARTAAEIALSVLAEIVAERRAAQRHAAERPGPPEQAAPVRAVDPVCGMTVAAVDATPHAEVDGTTTWFCCAGCRDRFLEDPDRYAAAP
ncbi:XdhC family protein [Trujillonella endophytica]|uniref:Xanthine dehydrogenase accessory factor n=1 Tax=Trujillonella endophytica TaxID=673521 RepID=A0A1H8T005_9ACTN|nr:XdhC family protein [Trujillella endophytica]SEO83803.1 xanthine dehydrogenase accessory factor [Trujillella endophytica]